jgi:hypothetical protein
MDGSTHIRVVEPIPLLAAQIGTREGRTCLKWQSAHQLSVVGVARASHGVGISKGAMPRISLEEFQSLCRPRTEREACDHQRSQVIADVANLLFEIREQPR